MLRAVFVISILLLIKNSIGARIIKEKSDGTDDHLTNSSMLVLNLKSSTVTCEPLYGFLPCTTELWGELFLIVVYEYLISLGQRYVSSGSDLFFKMFGTGIFGASLFQLLGTIPQVVMMLATGLSGTTDTVQEMAAMGMSMLAGSAVMLLTLVWGGCVVFGSYHLSEASTSDEETTSVNTLGASTRPFRLTGYGVKTEAETNSTARIMLLSMIPFLFLLLAKVINSSSGTRIIVIIAITVTLIFLSVYMIYQAFQPWMQERRLEYLLYKDIPKGRLQNLLNKDSQPNLHAIKELFKKFDKDNDGSVSVSELKAFILGVQAEGLGLNKENHAEKVMTLFDISGNDQISEEEFTNGVKRWLQHVYGKHEKTKFNKGNGHSGTRNGHSGTRQKTNNEEQQSLLGKEEENKGADKSWVNYLKAAFLLIYGTGIIVLLGVPLMEAIQTFSSAANISSFYVTYLVIPWATNYKVAVQAIVSARKKTEKSMSLTLTELHSGVFMNNLTGLATFLAFVLLKDFTWDVTAEALIVLIICTMMGSLDGYLETMPLWLGILACLLYPISLGVLYLFTAVLGWS